MKRMHFKNRRKISFMGPAIVLIVALVIGIVAFSFPKTPTWIKTAWIVGQIAIAFYLFLRVYVRHYFFWNEKEAMLKSKGFLGKLFRFEDVASWEYDNHNLKLRMKSFKTFEFDLSKIRQSDKDRLVSKFESILNLKRRGQSTTSSESQ